MLPKRLGIALQVAVCIAMMLTCVAPALAVDPAADPAGPDSPGESDDSVLEVGVWYVNDYEDCGGWGLGDLGGVHIDALGARDRLSSGAAYPSPAWTPRFAYGNYSAWEEDWKQGSAGGTEDYYIDGVDLAYFSGHGHSSGFFFGVYGNKRDDCQLTKSDALYSWGTKDNDWIALSACQVLDNPYDSYRYWARAMNGTRLIMGMQTPMSDAPTGDWFGWYVRNNQSFTYAWFKAADVLLGSDEVARILAERGDYFGDTWSKHNVATAVDNYFSVWTHRAKTPFPVAAAAERPQANLEMLNGEMPVFKVQPLSTGEANALWADLGTAFGVSNTTIITEAMAAGLTAPGEGPEIYYTPDAEMVMDTSAGLYQYANADALWTPAAALQAATADGVHAIGPTEAYTIAAQFLTQNQLMPGDVRFATVAQDVVAELQDPARFASAAEAAATPLQVLAETPTNYVVNWQRYITYTVPGVGAAGAQADVEFPVVGPGSKLDVYVATTAPTGVTGAALLQESILGGNGGSRIIQPPSAQGAGADEALTTPMLPPTTIKTLFEKLGGSVVLGYVPIAAESMEVQTIQTAAYWDGPMRWQQDQLIPVYIVPVQATLPLSLPVPLPLQSGAGPAAGHATQLLTQYIPVNSSYMAPYAKILSPAPGAAVLPGAQVVLEAADASKTLAALGVDPTLNFALGTGDPDSYEYNWYRDEVAAANLIGTTRVLNYTPPGVSLEEGKPTQIKIVLEVVDALSPRDPKTAYAEVIFDVNNVFAPFVQK